MIFIPAAWFTTFILLRTSELDSSWNALSKCKTVSRCLILRGVEHNPGRASNSESAIKQQAKSTDHNIYPRDVYILENGVNNYKRGFHCSLSTQLWTATP